MSFVAFLGSQNAPKSHWRSLHRSPNPLARFKGLTLRPPTSKGRRGEEGRVGEERGDKMIYDPGARNPPAATALFALKAAQVHTAHCVLDTLKITIGRPTTAAMHCPIKWTIRPAVQLTYTPLPQPATTSHARLSPHRLHQSASTLFLLPLRIGGWAVVSMLATFSSSLALDEVIDKLRIHALHRHVLFCLW